MVWKDESQTQKIWEIGAKGPCSIPLKWSSTKLEEICASFLVPQRHCHCDMIWLIWRASFCLCFLLFFFFLLLLLPCNGVCSQAKCVRADICVRSVPYFMTCIASCAKDNGGLCLSQWSEPELVFPFFRRHWSHNRLPCIDFLFSSPLFWATSSLFLYSHFVSFGIFLGMVRHTFSMLYYKNKAIHWHEEPNTAY